jgi:glycosyltransferase involved in cell wall biosynthesis
LKFPARLERFYLGLLAVCGAWLLVQTYTRTGLVICLIVGPALLYLLGRRWLAAAALGAGIVGAALVVGHGGQTATRLLSLLSLTNAGYTGRLEVWQWAWSAFVQHPLLGVGPRNLQFVPGAPYSDIYRQRVETNAENTYLNILADMGVLGAAAVTTAVVCAVSRIRDALRTQTTWLGQAWHAGVGIGLLALLLDGTVHPTLYSSQVVGILCALIGLMPVPLIVKPAIALPPSQSTDDKSGPLASRIVFLITCRAFGEAEQQSLNLAAELQRTGVRVLISAPPGHPIRRHALARGVPISHMDLGLDDGLLHGWLGTLALALNPLVRPGISQHLQVLAQSESLVFICPTLRDQLLVTPRMSYPKIQVVWLLHSAPDSGLQRILFRRQWVTRAGDATALVSMSPLTGQAAVNLGLPLERVEVIPGTGSGEVRQGDDSAAPRIPDVIAVISPLLETKGVQYLIDALPRVIQVRPGARLAIAGSGPYEQELHQKISELHLEDRVKFFTDISEHGWLLRQASLFVYLSADPDEVLPAIILEAFAVGTPVVASAVGGIPDIVVDGSTGLLALPGDVASIATSIITLLDDTWRAERIGSAGRERVQQSYVSENSARTFLQLLVRLEGGQRPRAKSLSLPNSKLLPPMP